MKLTDYNNLEEKASRFENHINIDTIQLLDDFLNKVEDLNSSEKVFRGISEAKYKIYNSAQRLWITHELKYRFESYENYLRQIVSNFLETNPIISKFFKKIGIPTKEIPVLAFLQHFDSPTPLIDFTNNLNVALYFATNDVKHYPSDDIGNYFSIYILDKIEDVSIQKKMKDSIDDILKIDPNKILSKIPNNKKENERKNLDFINSILEKMRSMSSEKLLNLDNFFHAAPEIITESKLSNINYFTDSNLNILNQEGLFVMNTLAYSPLEEAFDIWKLLFVLKEKEKGKKELVSFDEGELNISKSFDFFLEQRKNPIRNFLTCVNIHKSFKQHVLSYLNDKGVTNDFIFPDVKHMVDINIKNILK